MKIDPDKDTVNSIVNYVSKNKSIKKNNESVNLSLTEGVGDSIKKIRNLAITMAKKNFNSAAPHLNMDKISPNTNFDGNAALNIATKTLSQQKQIDEGLRDTINKLAGKLFLGSGLGSIITGVVSLEGWTQYLEASFTKWYYTNIQNLAEPGVMKIMQDLQSANQAEGSIYGKFGMYAFFIFFTIALISLAVNKATKQGKKIKKEVNEGKFKVDDLVYNTKTKTVGIVRMGDDKYGEVKTDADGNVDVDDLEKYNPIKFKHQSKAKVAPSTEKEVNSRGLFNPFKNESVNEYDEWKNTRTQSKHIFRMLKQKYNNNISKMRDGLEDILKQNKTKNDQAEVMRDEFNKFFKIKTETVNEVNTIIKSKDGKLHNYPNLKKNDVINFLTKKGMKHVSNEKDLKSNMDFYIVESVNEAKFKSPDYIISTTSASKLPPTRLAHADVSLGLKMAEKLKNYTLDVRHYNLIHANGKVALKLTPQGKTAVRVRTEDDPKYLQLIQKTVNDIVADYVSKIKESVNEATLKPGTKLRYEKNNFVIDYVVDKEYTGKDGFDKYILKVVKSNFPNKIKVGSTEEYDDSKLTGLIRSRVMQFVKNESVNESHFKVGDKVKMSHGGVGVVKSLDKEDGADDEKYYGVQLPNGEIHKHSPNELSLVNEGVSSTDMDKIKGAVEAAKSLMGVGAELKKLGMKYTFATEPLPIYIIQPTPNNKVAVVNKKYATKPDFVVGDIAVGIMESKIVNEGNAFGMAVTKAKKEGKKEFEFNGKTYKVKKGSYEKNEAAKKLTEKEKENVA
jgi:hypothetical protein